MLTEEYEFEFLENLLRKLKFAEYEFEDSYLFEHASSDTIIRLPKKTEKRHFEMVKKLVIDRGIVDEAKFQEIILYAQA